MHVTNSVPPVSPFGLRMPSEIRNWVEVRAKNERMSINSFILRLIEKAKETSNAS